MGIVLDGEEGDGKNRFFNLFKNIVGKNTELERGKHLFDKHSCYNESCIEKEKLFVCVNKARGKDNYETANIPKSRITTETCWLIQREYKNLKVKTFVIL